MTPHLRRTLPLSVSIVAGLLLLLVTGAPTATAQEYPSHTDAPSIELHVKGMSCAYCVRKLERQLGRVDAIVSVTTELETGLVQITLIPDTADADEEIRTSIEKAVNDAGFEIERLVFLDEPQGET
jgi:copper chaperone CopZ